MAYTGPFPYTNAGTTSGIIVSHTSFSGNLENTGIITGNGIAVSGSTINGEIVDSGYLAGGISLDVNSKLIASGMGLSGVALSEWCDLSWQYREDVESAMSTMIDVARFRWRPPLQGRERAPEALRHRNGGRKPRLDRGRRLFCNRPFPVAVLCAAFPSDLPVIAAMP